MIEENYICDITILYMKFYFNSMIAYKKTMQRSIVNFKYGTKKGYCISDQNGATAFSYSFCNHGFMVECSTWNSVYKSKKSP